MQSFYTRVTKSFNNRQISSTLVVSFVHVVLAKNIKTNLITSKKIYKP